MDTDTELIALLAKLRKLTAELEETENQQALIRAELDKTKARADELTRRSSGQSPSEGSAQ